MGEGEVVIEKKANPIKGFITGGFGGVCTILSGHPLDTIKVLLQTMPPIAAGQEPLYKGTWDCAKKTMQKDGFFGLYKGVSAPLLGVTPIFAMCFAGYEVGKRIQQTGDSAQLTYPQVALAGAFSSLFTTTIVAPVERFKVLLQTQGSTSQAKYTSLTDVGMQLYKEGGITSIYKGTCATLLRDLPGNAVYFLTYEFLQDQIKAYTGNPHPTLLGSIVAGGLTGMVYWIAANPADVLKSRMQSAPEGTYKHGIRSVFAEMMSKEGPTALYKGIIPVMIRAFPANAACFFGIELLNMVFRAFCPNF